MSAEAVSVRERLAVRGEAACEFGLPTVVYACMLLVLRDQIMRGDHGGWLMMSAIAVAVAFIGTAFSFSGWLMLMVATHASDSMFEVVTESREAEGGDENRPWLFEDEDRP